MTTYIKTSHCILGLLILLTSIHGQAAWQAYPTFDQRQTRPPSNPSGGAPIKPGDAMANEQKFRWVIGDLEIPAEIKDKPVLGKPVGLIINGGDGGEVWLNGEFQSRFDNDHPALVLVSTAAETGKTVRVAIQFYGKVQGGNKFDEANWTLVDARRAIDTLSIKLSPNTELGPVPNGIIGLSQGGGLADYEESTALKLKEGGFKWFRMDNVLTSVLKKTKEGEIVHDWKELDRRVDFMHLLGADFILCASFMPQVLDAIPNPDRQSAPKDYQAWEDLCYQAAKRCLDRQRRVPFWEVWNEVNTGWLKPGPEDTGAESFKKIYSQALGKEATDKDVVRRFEAYCKLYRATARGVLKADPTARIGGPALASGPFENSERGHSFHGKGFTKGLMLWCRQEKLPLNFVSWHEYFQPAEVILQEANTFRQFLTEFPEFKIESLMVTEWNEAWWADRPQDHEIGAAWCANTVIRAFIPGKVDRPCFFYVKQNDMNFRGDYSLLMQNNTPKASYNMAKIFNSLRGNFIQIQGGDDEICAVAAWDKGQNRMTVVLVNYRDRHNTKRSVHLEIAELPTSLKNGEWRESLVDGTHANVWNDPGKAEMQVIRKGPLNSGRFDFEATLAPHSITRIEFVKSP